MRILEFSNGSLTIPTAAERYHASFLSTPLFPYSYSLNNAYRTELSATNPDVPRYQVLSKIISSTPLFLRRFTALQRDVEHRFLDLGKECEKKSYFILAVMSINGMDGSSNNLIMIEIDAQLSQGRQALQLMNDMLIYPHKLSSLLIGTSGLLAPRSVDRLLISFTVKWRIIFHTPRAHSFLFSTVLGRVDHGPPSPRGMVCWQGNVATT